MLARHPTRILLSVLAVLAFALALPAVAPAATTYMVDSSGDQPDEDGGAGECETTLGTCTLRAAIQVSNFSTGVKDKIDFDNIFGGKAGDTIVLGSALPNIVDPVTIDGDGINDNRCNPEASSLKGPCVEVSGPNVSTAALVVDNADGVTIEGLSVTGSRTAISVINSSSSFVAHGDWLGVKLDGTAGGNTTGIFLDPNSNGATIGGTTAVDHNVFGNNSAEGLDIEGADNADVLGNYFGVKPDGATQAANGRNIEITDTIAFEANGDEVGTTVEGAAVTTQACDGGCNVVSGSTGSGIDLVGDGIGQNELPASGPTTVRGNFVGLNSAGVTTVSAGPLFDILAGAAKDVTVGGAAAGDANYIAGGSYGIYQENSNGFQALGNVIGRRPDGAGVTAPGSAGIFLFSLSSTGRETVEDNTIRLDGGAGIEQRFGGADIAGNVIEEGQYGILTFGAPGAPGGNAIEENTIVGAELNGVLIKNENNLLVGNLIEGSSQAAIRIEGATGTGTLIGGDLESEENEISANGGDAIEVAGEEDDDTQIARNHGADNAGLFIDLGADGAGNKVSGPNAGIQPPTISTATVSSASGAGALPGATIRVFRKATASPGELQSFLGKATADGEGKWSLTYGASIPGGTNIGATQSDVEGTSELSFATTATPPSEEEEKKNPPVCFCGTLPPPPPAPRDTLAPTAAITKAPKGKTHSTTAKFKFSASEAGSSFECKLDRSPYRACRSPKKYKHLKPGKHVFRVRATDTAGNAGTPAKKKFRILP